MVSVARIAAISGARKTCDLIPLCHNIPINKIEVSFVVREDRIDIGARAVCDAKTGIEMEALTAVSIAALTIYDMCKAVDKKMIISNIKLDEKKKESAECGAPYEGPGESIFDHVAPKVCFFSKLS